MDARLVAGGARLDYDVCIVGGGPAGITVALELASTSLRVVIIESGGRTETAQGRDLNHGVIWREGAHESLVENRRRQWGGATSVWGGRCIPLDELDFAPRDWVPESGWPFAKSELDPYYQDAMKLCEAGAYTFTLAEALPGAPAEMIAGFRGKDVATDRIERWGPPTQFGRRYAPRLESAPNVTIMLNGTCRHIQLDETGTAVREVEIATSEGTRFSVRADRFVLAAGSLENARLMLVSDDVATAGVGNGRDQVGRHYMTHLSGTLAVARVPQSATHPTLGFERDVDGVYCRRRFWVTDQAQTREGTLNTVFFSVRPPSGASGHRNPLFSGVHLLKLLRSAVVQRRPGSVLASLRANRTEIRSHLAVVVAGLPSLAPMLAAMVRGRLLSRRRLPMILAPSVPGDHHIYFQAEQTPNRESRVTLHHDVDHLGMRRLLVHPAFTELDVESVVRSHGLLRDQFADSGAGELRYDEDTLRQSVEAFTAAVNTAAHQLGTTRMSHDPEHGVVDASCQVHGIANLYVAGASVFPTGGHANPTLTLVALAIRLGRYLRDARPI